MVAAIQSMIPYRHGISAFVWRICLQFFSLYYVSELRLYVLVSSMCFKHVYLDTFVLFLGLLDGFNVRAKNSCPTTEGPGGVFYSRSRCFYERARTYVVWQTCFANSLDLRLAEKCCNVTHDRLKSTMRRLQPMQKIPRQSANIM